MKSNLNKKNFIQSTYLNSRYFKKLLFEKKGNFFGDIFNLDDDYFTGKSISHFRKCFF